MLSTMFQQKIPTWWYWAQHYGFSRPPGQLKVCRAKAAPLANLGNPVRGLGSWTQVDGQLLGLLREVREEDFKHTAGSSASPPAGPRAAWAQSANCSLVMFLWCMLWWRTSSSDRANFF